VDTSIQRASRFCFGLSIGLGIAVHEGFFLVAGAIAVGALTVATAHALQEHAEPCTTGSSTSLSI
jgi:hypothetical protein